MTYEQTLQFLYQRLPMFTRLGKAAYKADLGNTLALCEAINNPHHHFNSVHIAGTNGKGSVSHSIAAVLQQAGYRTGLYTSPHLRDFRERIRINGEMIPKENVVAFTTRITDAIEKINPSFFEVTVAMAFDWFSQQQVDIAIIETGLGGRLDSTNVIRPLLSIITNIGYDHMDILGNTLDRIAGEKAGIIKKNTPVIIGESLPETRPVFEAKALLEEAPISYASEKRTVVAYQYDVSAIEIQVIEEDSKGISHYQLDLPGIYQTKNILSVLEALAQLRQMGFTIPETAVQQGLRQVKKLTGLGGRWEVLRRDPLLILDVAHNEDGIRQLLQQVSITPHRHLHIVIGMVKDKAIDNILSLLPNTATYYFTQASLPRALDARLLHEQAVAKGLHGSNWPSVNDAIRQALANVGNEDLILVCGSIFVVGEVPVDIAKA
jgi:dihydrofolate synthase / folylpolyglutamate synthase